MKPPVCSARSTSVPPDPSGRAAVEDAPGDPGVPPGAAQPASPRTTATRTVDRAAPLIVMLPGRRGRGAGSRGPVPSTPVRLVIARCSVDYIGRLTAHLPMATRLLLV